MASAVGVNMPENFGKDITRMLITVVVLSILLWLVFRIRRKVKENKALSNQVKISTQTLEAFTKVYEPIALKWKIPTNRVTSLVTVSGTVARELGTAKEQNWITDLPAMSQWLFGSDREVIRQLNLCQSAGEMMIVGIMYKNDFTEQRTLSEDLYKYLSASDRKEIKFIDGLKMI